MLKYVIIIKGDTVMIQKKDKKFLKDKDYNLALEKYFMSNYYSDANKDNDTVEKVYYSSNEVLDDEFKNFGDMNGKRVLTVGSSGDQLLSAIYYGAKDVTLIDANIFSRYFTEYKIAMIKNFDYETYYNVFFSGYHVEKIFEHNVYSKIFHDLSPEAQEFWGTIFLEETSAEEIVKKFFHDPHGRKMEYFKFEDSYNKCKQNLQSANIHFINAELSEFPKVIDGKFDLIMLSNIFDYLAHDKNDTRSYIKTINKLFKKYLNPDGKIQAYYSFGSYAPKFESIRSYIKSKNVRKEKLPTTVSSQYVITKKDNGENQMNNE
jgi:hypothetical protein